MLSAASNLKSRGLIPFEVRSRQKLVRLPEKRASTNGFDDSSGLHTSQLVVQRPDASRSSTKRGRRQPS